MAIAAEARKEKKMKKCVVLLGFSTTGKSSILTDFTQQYSSLVECIDSDSEIAKPNGGHIYNIYFDYLEKHDTQKALQEIERREREFLTRTKPTDKPLLLASGPYLPTRTPQWDHFVAQANPVFIYLQKSAEDVTNGLFERRRRQENHPTLFNRYGFGCWDQGVITNFENNTWNKLADDESLENVRRNMDAPVRLYEKLAHHTFTWKERQEESGKARLSNTIVQKLGLDEETRSAPIDPPVITPFSA